MQQKFRCAVVALSLSCFGGTAFAQATRTWVSGVGDDANPCSRIAPCKTFAGALSKTAASGVISVLDPGGFGPVTITKGVTIDGGGVDGSIVGAQVNGIIVNAAATDQVTLRNLTIYGMGTGLNGIRVLGSTGSVTIDNCVITGFNLGIDHQSTGKLQVYDSTISGNKTFGVHLRTGRGVIDNVRFDSNAYDAVRVSNAGRVVVRGSVASGHGIAAFSAIGTGSVLALEDCSLSSNVWGVNSVTGGAITLSNTTIADSTTQALFADGASTLVSFGNNRLTGNAADGTFTGSVQLQ
jgi:hypothetical protein